jgi:dipeptidyl-peptidase 4
VGSVGPRTFQASRRGQAQALAELGFIVVQIDALGTPMRSREFHSYYYGDLADNGLPDQIAAMRQLAEQHAWIDLDRVGIYGHSGGGFATAAAMLQHADFFHVGVASAGNLDNRGYTYYWGEKWQGLLVPQTDGADSYTNQALHLLAENLRGRLLLAYGTMDANVHPNMTLLLINELIRHNKDFDVVVMPNRGHGFANEPFFVRKTWDYFVRHLLNAEPPREFPLASR